MTSLAEKTDDREGDWEHQKRDCRVADPHGKEGGCEQEGGNDGRLVAASEPEQNDRQPGVQLAPLHSLGHEHTAEKKKDHGIRKGRGGTCNAADAQYGKKHKWQHGRDGKRNRLRDPERGHENSHAQSMPTCERKLMRWRAGQGINKTNRSNPWNGAPQPCTCVHRINLPACGGQATPGLRISQTSLAADVSVD